MERNPEAGGGGEPVDLDEVTESMATLTGADEADAQPEPAAPEAGADDVVPVQPEPAVPATEPELGGVGEPVEMAEMAASAEDAVEAGADDVVPEQPEPAVPATEPELGGVGEPVDMAEMAASAEEAVEAGADEVVPEQPEPAVPATEPEIGGVGEPVDLEEMIDTADEVAAQPEVAAPEPGPLPVGTDLPDLTDDRDLQGAVEALLLVVDSPIEVEAIADALEEPVDRTLEVINRIAERYTDTGSGIDLRRTGGGWRFYTRDRFAPFVEKLLLDGQRAKLTRAALETLAVIAYRQPVTRSRVAAVRGVNVDGVIRTLLARGLVEETGTDQETGGFLYRTTELFLERLGLSSLEDLPPLAPLLPEVDAIDDI